MLLDFIYDPGGFHEAVAHDQNVLILDRVQDPQGILSKIYVSTDIKILHTLPPL